MKRGPAPNKGLGFAIPVALALGRVMFFVASPYYPADFEIAGDGYLGIIRLRLSEKIRATLPEIQKDYSLSVTELASLPRGGPVCCELWLYSRYGRLRFFRVTETGLEEIDRSLIVSKMRTYDGTGDLAALRSMAQFSDVPVTAEPVIAGPAVSQKPEDPTAKFIRYLKKRNAVKKPVGGKTEATEPIAPGKNPDTPAPVAKAGRKTGKKLVGENADVSRPVDSEKFPDPRVPAAAGQDLPVISQVLLTQETSAAPPGSLTAPSPAGQGSSLPTENEGGS